MHTSAHSWKAKFSHVIVMITLPCPRLCSPCCCWQPQHWYAHKSQGILAPSVRDKNNFTYTTMCACPCGAGTVWRRGREWSCIDLWCVCVCACVCECQQHPDTPVWLAAAVDSENWPDPKPTRSHSRSVCLSVQALCLCVCWKWSVVGGQINHFSLFVFD